MPDPIALLEQVAAKGNDQAMQNACQDIARDLVREPVYLALLDRVLGFHGRPSSSSMGPDGGWMNRPRRAGGALLQEKRFALMSGLPVHHYNIYHILYSWREVATREAVLDEDMVPHRTYDFLNGDPFEAVEKVATDNSRRLYETLMQDRTFLRAQQAPSSGASGGVPAMTRLPLKLPMLDHYHYCFAYWTMVRKRGQGSDSSFSDHLGSSRRKEDYAYQAEVAKGGVTPQAILASKHLYFETLQSYLELYFPRKAVPESQQHRHLALGAGWERFLRIFIDMWLERNTVLNPNSKPQGDRSDKQNRLCAHTYKEPFVETLQALLVLLQYLLGRKVEAEVGAQNPGRGGGNPRAPAYCGAVDALQQPLFNFFVLAFRDMRVAPNCWTQFFLVVELWMAWLEPDAVLARAFPERRDQPALGLRWRKDFLRSYVVSNFHFYTTLLVLYMGKAREALSSDPARQPLLLAQVLRVLKLFHHTDLRDALVAVSRLADDFWRSGNTLSGGDFMLYHHHLCRLRLVHSRPCLLEDACQDAHHLAAELLATRKRAVNAAEAAQRSWKTVQWAKALASGAFALLVGADQESGVPSRSAVPSALVQRIDEVLEEVYGIFPSVQAKCQQPFQEGDVSARDRDADRQGLLLTNQGRDQLLRGLRNCDPTKARYLGDPLFNPEVGSYESEWLLRWVQELSLWLSTKCYPAWQQHPGKPGEGVTEEKGDDASAGGGHILIQNPSSAHLTPINLRWLADTRILKCFFVALAMVALSSAVLQWLG